MIYSFNLGNQLEQGDICKELPKITPDQFFIEDGMFTDAWEYYASVVQSKDRSITFSAKPVLANGVVLTQTCDITEGNSILFAELEPRDLSSNPKGRINQIRKILRDQTRFHYFPPADNIDLLNKPHVINFQSLFLVPYDIIKKNESLFFLARLHPEAQKVLCDKINRFFTRLAFEDLIFYSQKEIEFLIENDDSITMEDVNRVLNAIGRTLF